MDKLQLEIQKGLDDVKNCRVYSISELSQEQLKQEIQKGLDDIKNGRVHKASDVFTVLKLIAKGDICAENNDFENAEKFYRESTMVCKDRKLTAEGFYKLGLLYYKFKRPEILYSKLYFELALEYGEKNASYYLATIYEWINKKKITNLNLYDIDYLYTLAAEEATDENVRKLALERNNK